MRQADRRLSYYKRASFFLGLSLYNNRSISTPFYMSPPSSEILHVRCKIFSNRSIQYKIFLLTVRFNFTYVYNPTPKLTFNLTLIPRHKPTLLSKTLTSSSSLHVRTARLLAGRHARPHVCTARLLTGRACPHIRTARLPALPRWPTALAASRCARHCSPAEAGLHDDDRRACRCCHAGPPLLPPAAALDVALRLRPGSTTTTGASTQPPWPSLVQAAPSREAPVCSSSMNAAPSWAKADARWPRGRPWKEKAKKKKIATFIRRRNLHCVR
jgi:hypothetical protein